jgi:DNA-binding beta-propeller fold protein YncE
MAFEGNTISIIDVDRARQGDSGAEVRRLLVGTSDPNVQTRPFIPSFTPNGREIIVPNFRADNVSIVDLQRALAGDPGAEVARIPLVRPADADGVARPARPKGSAVTADGRYAVISGGARTTFEPSGTVWIIHLRSRKVVATVTGVGNDPYGLAVVDVDDHRGHGHGHGHDRD